jgi:hypothetical protein
MPCFWSLGKEQSGEFIFRVPGHALNLPRAPELKADDNPYRGLKVYEEQDAGLFFGRDKVVEDLAKAVARQPLTMVLGASGTGKSSLVRAGLLSYPRKIAAANGVPDAEKPSDAVLFGKDASAEGVFHRILMRPADAPAAPLRELMTRLSRAGSPAPGPAPIGSVTDETPDAAAAVSGRISSDAEEEASHAVLSGKDGAAGSVVQHILMRPAAVLTTPLRWLIKRPRKEPSGAPSESATAVAAFSSWFAVDPKRHLLLVIDQFEELITLCHDRERAAFLQFLADLIDRERERLRIVLTLRSDFEPLGRESVLERHLAADRKDGEARFLVPPLQQDELREIIEKPASERVLFFEPPALVDWLINEVIQMPGALPLLSFALSELYLKYVERHQTAQQNGKIINRTITEADYREVGGVVGALGKRANEEYETFDDKHRRTLQKVMLRMVATGGELVRRRVPYSELIYSRKEETQRASAVIERLKEARLVVSGRTGSSYAANGDGGYVEPAHDALVRSWGNLLDWKREAERASRPDTNGRPSDTDAAKTCDLPVQRQLTEAAAEWARRKRDTGLLWTGDPRLPRVRPQLKADDSWLNKTEWEFVYFSNRRRIGLALTFLLLIPAWVVFYFTILWFVIKPEPLHTTL